MRVREGFETLDGKETATAGVGRLACEYHEFGLSFSIATEDFGEAPLGVTMAHLCSVAGWNMVDAQQCLQGVGLGHLLT